MLRPRIQIALLVFSLLGCGGSAWSQRPVFEQLADTLDDGTLLVDQGGWNLRVETEKSPRIGDFLGSQAIITSPDAAADDIVSATYSLAPNLMWDGRTSLVLEFEVAFEDGDPNSQAMVGIGSTIGGIPPYVGIYANRIIARQVKYGEVGYASGADGSRLALPPGEWIRIRAVFLKEHENESPTVTVTSATVDDPGDETEATFDLGGMSYSDFPIANTEDVALFDYVNLLWVRAQGSAAIRDITLLVE